jgi:hypothetical protein
MTGGSMAKCQRVGCGVLTDDRKRRVVLTLPGLMYSYDCGGSLSTYAPLQVDLVLCEACALELGATEVPKGG